MPLRFDDINDLPPAIRAQLQKSEPASLKMPANKKSLTVPTESEEQQVLFEWVEHMTGQYPVLEYLFHIPNGGSRGKGEAGRFKAEGVKAGVPDLCLPAPLGGYHGLYIEMKRKKGSKTSQDQKRWMAFLAGQGYCVRKCLGAAPARRVIQDYLEERITE